MTKETRYIKDLTEDEWLEIEELYKQGVRIKDIANQYNKSEHAVGRILKQRCKPRPRAQLRRRINTLTDKEWAEIKELYSSGMLIKDIAVKYDVCADTFGTILKKKYPEVDTRLLQYVDTTYGRLQVGNKTDWEPLYKDYINGTSLKELSRKAKVGYKTLLRVFSIHGFQRVSKEEERRRCRQNTEAAMLKKYGVATPFDLPEILQKCQDTCRDKYGVDNPGQADFVKEKIKNTCRERYGTEWTTQTMQMKEKSKQTCRERYGTDYYMQTDEYKERAKKTCLEKYGATSYAGSEDMKQRIKEISREKYGVDHFTQADWYKQQSHDRQTKENQEDVLKRLEGKDITLLDEYNGIYSKISKEYFDYHFKCNKCGTIFMGRLNQVLLCPKCYPQGSTDELIIKDIVQKYYSGPIDTHIHIEGKEIDIYLPEIKVGIEVNGYYWHSAKRKPKRYHQQKTDLMQKHGIKLIHIWTYQDYEAVEHRIKSLFGVNERVYARNTEVQEVCLAESKPFFDANHIDGFTSQLFTLGLYKEGQLLACISFRRHKEGLEIARFATKDGYTVVGGFSKLLKHAIRYIKDKYSSVKKIVTFCDRDWTSDYKDSVYYKNGFTFVKDSGPILRYYDNKTNRLVARQQLQRHKVKEKYPEIFDEDLTTNQILDKVGIWAMYNSGNWKFEMEI